VLVVVATLCATGAFRLLGKILFSAFRNRRPPDYAFVVKGLEARLKRLEERENELNETLKDKDKPVDVSSLARQVNTTCEKLAPGKQALSEQAPTTYRELEATLREIMGRLVELETNRSHFLPPSTAKRQEFRDEQLYVIRTPEEMADLRYLGVWGPYDPRDASKSDWWVREANRFITKGQAKADASRERRWALFGIIVAFAVGIVAAGAAVLAIPTKDSIFCKLGIPERLSDKVACEKG